LALLLRPVIVAEGDFLLCSHACVIEFGAFGLLFPSQASTDVDR
jgi:hypothetical protein